MPAPVDSSATRGGGSAPSGGAVGSDPPPREDAAPAFGPVAELAQIERGTPADWVLYDLGRDASSDPSDLHVDGDGVYWVQSGGRIYRGSKDGKVAPVSIGTFAPQVTGYNLASDETHLYWYVLNHLRSAPKTGGETEEIELSYDHTGGNLTVDAKYVYLATWGCRTITRIDKQSRASNVMEIELQGVGVGSTTLATDGDELICASWDSVFVVPRWGEPALRLVDSAKTIYGLVVTADDIYWIDRNNEAGDVLSIGRVARTGGAPEVFRPSDMKLGWGTRGIVHAPAHKRLYFVADSWIASFSLDTHRYAVHALDRPTGYVDIDANHFYFTSLLGPGSIKRMPLDHAPVYMLP